MPMVSVIIPVYNVEQWLRESLDSVVHQTLQDIEIICVNDGSTDASPEILREYAADDERIRIIDQENRGLSGARNSGVRAATGKYLCFFDSDDILNPETMELCAADMERRGLDYLCFNASAFGEDTDSAKEAGERNSTYFKRALSEEKVFSGRELFAELKSIRAYISPAGTCMISRDSFLKYNLWFHEQILHEDVPWMFKVLMLLPRCGCMNRILYHYRMRGDSITHLRPSFAHVYGRFSGFMDEQKIVLENPELLQDEQLRKIVISHFAGLQKKIIQTYHACCTEEKQKRFLLNDSEYLRFQQNVEFPASLMNTMEQQAEDEKAAIGKKVKNLKKAKTILERDKAALERDKSALEKDRSALERDKAALERDKAALEKDNAALRKLKKKRAKEIRALKSSAEYRLGRVMTWLPRKIKGLFRKETKIQPGRKAAGSAGSPQPEEKKPLQIQPPLPNRMVVLPSEAEGNHILYHYELSGEWEACFRTENSFEITFPFDLEDIPESIRIIPFLSQVLPVAWICDAEIEIPFCDSDFADCFESVKAGYRKMYPEFTFGGRITVGQAEENQKSADKALVCFSGGVDAFSTTISHLPENPLLVSLWGSDVSPENEDGWRPVETLIRNNAEKLGLESITVRTSFRGLLNSKELSRKVKDCGDNWWHGFQHGIGILGHMAPVAWQESANTVYIASSFAPEYLDKYKCASHPSIDNHVQFCGTEVIHDGLDLNRQDKIGQIVELARERDLPILLHVCWEKQGGDNCCHCEKCWRTMLGLYAEGADPKRYGFPTFEGFDCLSDDLEQDFARFRHETEPNYMPIQKRLRERMGEEKLPSELSWFIDADLSRIEDGTMILHKGKLVRPVWLLGTPEHSNMGDQCIAEEELCFLRTVMPDRSIIEISETELREKKLLQLRSISPSQPVLLHGGGNLGTIWPEQEKLRRDILSHITDNPVVIFPQSIWFDEDEAGKEALDKARKTYRGDRLLLCCRDRVSYETARSNFSCRSMLIPDMVLWERKEPERIPERSGAMTLLRKDKERKTSDSDCRKIEECLSGRFLSVEVADTVLKTGKVTKKNREEVIGRLLFHIASMECVVTDRLHGMVLCAVTETPCVVMSNSYHKVEACYEWLKDLGYIRFIHDMAELEEAVDSVCSCAAREYPEKKIRESYLGLVRYLEDVDRNDSGANDL